jgi:hypothetical protein
LANFLIQEDYLEPAIKACEVAAELQISNYKISQIHNLALSKKAISDEKQALNSYYERLKSFPITQKFIWN